jgi:catechol 2,3-dioxygenase-like lactoylglutathione lyase family enzyme
MTHALRNGQIIGGLSVVPDLGAALRDYRDVLGLTLVESAPLSNDLAQSWGCPNSTGLPMAILQPQSRAHCVLRLVEQPDHPDYKPTTTYGWAAYELTVQDVLNWPQRLTGSGFNIVGPPKELPGLPYFVPMQVLGSGQEMVYLNEVRGNTPSSDLPKAISLVDHIFICILAAQDRAKTVKWYQEKLRLNAGETYTLPYSMINNAFGLSNDHMSDLTMVQNGRMTILEVDDYPAQSGPRLRHDGMLPPGNALVTLAVDRLDNLKLDWIAPPCLRNEMPYAGSRAATVRGPSGELLELVGI